MPHEKTIGSATPHNTPQRMTTSLGRMDSDVGGGYSMRATHHRWKANNMRGGPVPCLDQAGLPDALSLLF